MDLYCLNSSFQKVDVIDIFDSLIWTERYAASGDIVLVVPASDDMRSKIVEGVFLSIPESQEIMLIDTVNEEDGQITATGNSLVDFLKHRILRNTWTTDKDSWSITGAPGAIAGTIVSAMCVASGAMATGSVLPSVYGASEVITGLSIGSLAGGTSVTVAVPYGNVYDGVKAVCDLDGVGFTLYPNSISPSGYTLVFTTYKGLDRTSSQSTNPVVIFDPALDSFTDIKTLRSIAGYKTAAFAWANGLTAQSQIGYAFAPGTSGLTDFARRTLMVEASDVNAADYSAADLTSILNQKAKDALANNNYVRMTDGQIVPQQAYVYGTDYSLGDVIELRGNNTSQKARIVEYIRAQDSTGTKNYPTLSVVD